MSAVIRPLAFLFVIAPLFAITSGQAREVPGALIDIGGHQVHLFCEGDGPITILTDLGAGGWSFTGVPLHQELQSMGYRSCLWDRPGLGFSETDDTERTSSNIVAAMKAMIENAPLPRPLVLAGHSFGGQNVRLFAAQHPQLIDGVVLIDAAHEDQWEQFDPSVWQAVKAQAGMLRGRADALESGQMDPPPVSGITPETPQPWQRLVPDALARAAHYRTMADEMALVPESNAELARSGDLADLPLLVITAERSFYTYSGSFDDAIVASANDAWLELQESLLALSANSRQVVVPDVTHRLISTHPTAVALLIDEFIEEITSVQNPERAEMQQFNQLLDSLTRSYQNQNPEAFSAHFSADVQVRDVNRRQYFNGREEWRELSKRVMAAHDWMRLTAFPVARSENAGVAKLRWSGVLNGEAIGRARDIHYNYEGVALMTLSDSGIKTHSLYIDHPAFLTQLGNVDQPRHVMSNARAWEEYTGYWQAGDLDNIARFFAHDAYLMPSGGGVVRGREEMRAWLRQNFQPGQSVVLSSQGVSFAGEAAIRRGTYKILVGGTEAGSGSFMQHWTMDNSGQWRIVSGLFNSDNF